MTEFSLHCSHMTLIAMFSDTVKCQDVGRITLYINLNIHLYIADNIPLLWTKTVVTAIIFLNKQTHQIVLS